MEESCGLVRPSLEPVNHPERRCLIGYYLCCQKPGRASTSTHQSLSVHKLTVDRAMEHGAHATVIITSGDTMHASSTQDSINKYQLLF